MKIHVSRVPAEGCQDRATYDPAPLDMGRVDIRLTEPFTVHAFITKAERALVVNAAIQCPLRLTCARCLEEFDAVVATDAVFSYAVHPTDVVDITDDVRQEIMLAYPVIPVCQAGCKGLCRTCGQNLNAAPCSHQTVA